MSRSFPNHSKSCISQHDIRSLRRCPARGIGLPPLAVESALLATSSQESLFFPFHFSAAIFSSNPRSVAVLRVCASQPIVEVVEHVEVVVVEHDRKVKMLSQLTSHLVDLPSRLVGFSHPSEASFAVKLRCLERLKCSLLVVHEVGLRVR